MDSSSRLKRLSEIKAHAEAYGVNLTKRQNYPNGIYTGRIISHVEGTTKNGDAKFDFTIEILSGPEGGSAYNGCKALLSLFFSPNGLPHVMSFIEKLPFYNIMDDLWLQPEKIYGVKIKFEVSHRNSHQNIELLEVMDDQTTSSVASAEVPF